MGVLAISYSERPELWSEMETVTAEVWPEYNRHGDVLSVYWARLFEEFPQFQFALYDDQQREVLAEGHTAPCYWDGTPEGLGDGIDAMIAAAFHAHDAGLESNAVCALAAEIPPRFQRRG